FDAPLMVAAMRAVEAEDQEALDSLNRMALAARETAELRLESEQMGYSLMQWVRQVPGSGAVDVVADVAAPTAAAVAWAVAASRLQLEVDDAVTGFLWSFAENQVMVLIKTI